MNDVVSQLSMALPEIILLVMACFTLLLDVCLAPRYRILTYFCVQLTLIIAFVVTLPQFEKFSAPVFLFSGHYVLDKLAVLSKLLMYFFSFFAFAYARDYLKARHIARSEYYLLGLFCVLGMSIMASAYSFLTIYLGVELLSLTLYAMVAMHKDSNLAVEAAMKYFVLGSLASGILLYGISILYGLTGSIEINTVATIVQTQQGTMVSVVALVFVLAGLMFKFGAVPFHMWVPDVYQGAPTPTTLFIASAPKIAAFAIILRILVQAMPSLQLNWEHMLIVISILSMFFGNILAIAQTNLKRMLAYSSIAHIGYTLLGVLAGPDSTQGYSAAMFYIATYVLVAVGAFAIITLMSRDGVEFDRLEDYRGLNARNPWLAFMMLLLLFSMAGVPPTVGFIAKLGLLEALVQAHLAWLAVLALVFALIGAYYYLRVVMLMYFEEPVQSMEHASIKLSPDMQVAISLNGAAVLLLGLLPSFFIDLCRITVG
jgi:NADH-quinone oxidoreductase subunit N